MRTVAEWQTVETSFTFLLNITMLEASNEITIT